VTFHGTYPQVNMSSKMQVSARFTTLPGGSSFIILYYRLLPRRNMWLMSTRAPDSHFVATPQACFVWQHTQELVGSPPVTSSPASRSFSSCAVVCFCAICGSREPGSSLPPSRGRIWFWNNIGVGLAGGEQYSKILLELQSNENINSLTRLTCVLLMPSLTSAQMFSAPNLRCIQPHSGACSG